MKLIAYTILVIFLFTSCQLEDEINLDLPQSKGVYMVECYLIPGQPARLSLYKTNPLNEKMALELEWKAQASITNGEKEYRLLNMLNVTDEGYIYNYISEDTITAGAGYALTIVTQEKDTLRSYTSSVSAAKMDTVAISGNTLSLSINNEPAESYYMVVLRKYNNTGFKVKSHLFALNSQSKSFPVYLKDNFQDYTKVSVSLYCITKENYDFQQSIDQAEGAGGNIFNVPAQIKSNVENSIGIFTYCTVDEQEIIMIGSY